MTKIFEFNCPKHGKVHIEVDKPPLISAYLRCPFCDRLTRARGVEVRKPEPLWEKS